MFETIDRNKKKTLWLQKNIPALSQQVYNMQIIDANFNNFE